MRLALAQLNPTIGDLEANAALIAHAADEARAARCDLLVCPELALTGYPPKDLLLYHRFITACTEHVHRLGTAASQSLTLVFGTPLPADAHAYARGTSRRLHNSLACYHNGALLAHYHKRLLPTYDVFDEDRYFEPANQPCVITVAGTRVGLSICEDLWRGHDAGFADRYLDAQDPVADLIAAGAQLIINPSASPFRVGMPARQDALLASVARTHRVTVAAVNQVGGNDELIFDGRASLWSPAGTPLAHAPAFTPALLIADLDPATGTAHAISGADEPTTANSTSDDLQQLFAALVLGVRDYARKTGFRSAVLGLSGGIDSALVAVIAAAALTPANIRGIALPSRYSSPGSIADAYALANALSVPISTIPIEDAFNTLERSLAPAFDQRPPDVTEENLQSRVRGTILMALSNKFGSLLLTTGNKSELAVGYCTLYGDMNGGLAVISDVPKTTVYKLARWINTHWRTLGIAGLKAPPIPAPTITKPPSAELRLNQTDQDSLPPYDVLDQIIELRIDQRCGLADITAQLGTSADAATITRVLRLIDVSEFKRKQAAIGLKVSGVAFGSGRRMPIAQRRSWE